MIGSGFFVFGKHKMKIIDLEGNEIPFTGKIRNKNGDLCYYKDGKLHREDGPAVEFSNGTKEWYLKGKLHRENGPAIEYKNGDKRFFINDMEVDFSFLMKFIKDKTQIFIGVENGCAKFLNEENIEEIRINFFVDKIKESIKNYTEWAETLSQILVSFEKDMNKND